MSVEQEREQAASLHTPPRRLGLMLLIAAIVATIVVVVFVLPAELRIDPTGIGQAMGLTRLAGPKQLKASDATASLPGSEGAISGAGAGAARYYDSQFRSDFIDIPLNASGSPQKGDELEYKIRLKAGATFVYSWTAEGITNPDELYFDFHGEAPGTAPNAEPTVIEYRQAMGTASNGTLTAPFDGIFGWYLQNEAEARVIVHLKLSGFYDLVPPGQNGNESSIEPNKALMVQKP